MHCPFLPFFWFIPMITNHVIIYPFFKNSSLPLLLSVTTPFRFSKKNPQSNCLYGLYLTRLFFFFLNLCYWALTSTAANSSNQAKSFHYDKHSGHFLFLILSSGVVFYYWVHSPTSLSFSTLLLGCHSVPPYSLAAPSHSAWVVPFRFLQPQNSEVIQSRFLKPLFLSLFPLTSPPRWSHPVSHFIYHPHAIDHQIYTSSLYPCTPTCYHQLLKYMN